MLSPRSSNYINVLAQMRRRRFTAIYCRKHDEEAIRKAEKETPNVEPNGGCRTYLQGHRGEADDTGTP